MKSIKLVITTIFALALSLAPVALAGGVVVAETATETGLCAGANLSAADIGNCDSSANNAEAASSIDKFVTLAINIFSWVVGVVAVIAIIIGGFKYITSGGDAGGVTGAKNTILYAIVGLIIVAVAQLIVKFVLGNVNSAIQ